jgi:hypothetical protein
VTLAHLVREGVRLEQRSRLLWIDVELDAAEIDEHVRAHPVVPQPRRQVESALPPVECLLVVLGEVLQLGEPAVRPRELDRLAQRLENRDRVECGGPRRVAVGDVPVEAREHLGAPAEGGAVAERAPGCDRTVDRPERVVEPVHGVRGARKLLQGGRPLARRKAVEERRRTPVLPVRLPVGVDCGRAPRRDERVLRHDVLRPRALGVVDEIGWVGLGREQCLQHLRVQPPSRGDGQARTHGLARQFVAEAEEARVHLEQRPPLGLLGGRGPLGSDGVKQGGRDAVRHHRHQLDEVALRRGEALDPAAHGVHDRPRRLGSAARGDQLADVEGIAPRGRVHLAGVLAVERGDGTL